MRSNDWYSAYISTVVNLYDLRLLCFGKQHFEKQSMRTRKGKNIFGQDLDRGAMHLTLSSIKL